MRERLGAAVTVAAVGMVDDLTLLPADMADLAHMIRILQRWCDLTGMRIHPEKCGWQRWLTAQMRAAATAASAADAAGPGAAAPAVPPPAAAAAPPETVDFFGAALGQAARLRALGFDLVLGDPAAHTVAVLQKARVRAEHIRYLKLPWVDTRVALIRSAVIGLLRYAPLMLRF
eukprot:gene8100-3946_t